MHTSDSVNQEWGRRNLVSDHV